MEKWLTVKAWAATPLSRLFIDLNTTLRASLWTFICERKLRDVRIWVIQNTRSLYAVIENTSWWLSIQWQFLELLVGSMGRLRYFKSTWLALIHPSKSSPSWQSSTEGGLGFHKLILMVLSYPVRCDPRSEMISSNTLLNLEATVYTRSKRPELTAMSKVLNINAHKLSNHDLVAIPEQQQN